MLDGKFHREDLGWGVTAQPRSQVHHPPPPLSRALQPQQSPPCPAPAPQQCLQPSRSVLSTPCLFPTAHSLLPRQPSGPSRARGGVSLHHPAQTHLAASSPRPGQGLRPDPAAGREAPAASSPDVGPGRLRDPSQPVRPRAGFPSPKANSRAGSHVTCPDGSWPRCKSRGARWSCQRETMRGEGSQRH